MVSGDSDSEISGEWRFWQWNKWWVGIVTVNWGEWGFSQWTEMRGFWQGTVVSEDSACKLRCGDSDSEINKVNGDSYIGINIRGE